MSAMSDLDFDPQRLADEGSRLQAITDWLTCTVWSPERYAASSSEDYLRKGEAAVCGLEELIADAKEKSPGRSRKSAKEAGHE